MRDFVIRTNANFKLGDGVKDTEFFSMPSRAVPGMAVPLQELISRYVKGREIPLQSDPVYEGHLNIPDLRVMDKVEREVYAQKVRAQISDYRNRLAEAEAQKEKSVVEDLRKQIADLQAASVENVGVNNQEDLSASDESS